MAPQRNEREPPTSSDDDIVSLASTQASEQREIYPLEAILWETNDEDGATWYLVKWEGYPDIRCTWEQEEHFHDEQTLVDWRDQQIKISRGLVEPFDLDGWLQRVEEDKIATAWRKARRRQKRIELGLPVADPAVEEEVEEEEEEEEEEERSSKNPSDDEYDGGLAESDDSGSSLFSESPDWTAKEESTLLEGLNRFKTLDWKKLLELYGLSGIINENLKEKSEKNLRRKALLLRKEFHASGREFPVPQSLDKTSSTIQRSRGKDKAVRLPGDQQEPASVKTGPIERTKYAGTAHPSKPQDVSQAPFSTTDRPEKQKVTIPSTETINSHGVASASATPKALAGAKSKANASSGVSLLDRRPILPSATAVRRPTQLGMVGRGPARKGVPATERPKEQHINVLENWDAAPHKRRRSRYDQRTPEEAKAKPGTMFKKKSTQRRHELAGRFEHAPDASSLTFVNLKDGKILPNGPTSIVPRPAPKTPFQQLQEQLAKGGNSSTDAIARPDLQRAATLDVSMDGSKREESVVEPRTLAQKPRRASVPFDPITNSILRDEPMCAAPVAVTSPNVNDGCITSSKQCLSPQHQGCLSPILNETVNDAVNAGKRGLEEESKQVLNPETPTSHASSLLDPSSHGAVYVHPERKKHGPSPHEPSQPILSQPMAANPQGRRADYELFPLNVPRFTQDMNTRLRRTDVKAEILTGSEGDSTGIVIFRGLPDYGRDRGPKAMFITIKVAPEQMHVWCKVMLTTGEFAIIFHDEANYLGSGWIVPNDYTAANVNKLSCILAEHASGGIFFAEEFMILVYPASCVGWEYLDKGFGHVPPEAKLRFAMLKPWPRVPQTHNEVGRHSVMSDHRAGPQAPPMNAVLSSQFGMDFQRLVTYSKGKDGSKAKPTPMFFLVFPPAAQEEFDVVVDWIRANGPATIYKHSDQGAWTHFCKMIDQGVVICHATFIDYWNIPFLAQTLKRTINMFNFSLEPISDLAPDPHLIRLFPAGTAFLLTDSLFLLRPVETARILLWFRIFILQAKPYGTWRICTRPA
ncbi:MAG: hypothetical protein L6R41_003452, partial [Letrouitia leprolyta]